MNFRQRMPEGRLSELLTLLGMGGGLAGILGLGAYTHHRNREEYKQRLRQRIEQGEFGDEGKDIDVDKL